MEFDGGDDGIFFFTNTGTNRTSFRTSDNTEQFTILDNGNVGIGTNTPTSKLTVNGLLTVGGISFTSSPSAPSFPTISTYLPITVSGPTSYLPLSTGGSAPLVNGKHPEAQSMAAGEKVAR